LCRKLLQTVSCRFMFCNFIMTIWKFIFPTSLFSCCGQEQALAQSFVRLHIGTAEPLFLSTEMRRRNNGPWDIYHSYCFSCFCLLNSYIFLTPGLQTASELYRPSDRRLSAKLVPTLADRGCRVVSATNPHDR
jgi:hypothetical protein